MKQKIINFVSTVVEKILGFFEWLGSLWEDSAFRQLYVIALGMVVTYAFKKSYDSRTRAYRERTKAMWSEKD